VSTPPAILLFVGGLAVTVVSSIVLARELDRIGERLGFSEALLGILTAVGADAPEISSAVAAIVTGHNETGVGVVVGSNVFNIAALLGLSAVIAGSVHIHRHGLALVGSVAALTAVVGLLLVVRWIPPVAALGLALLVVVPYVILSSLRAERVERLPAALRNAVREEQRDARRDEFAGVGSAFDALILVPALAGVIGGATAMVYAAQSLGHRWNVSDVVIGTIVLAALTGLPNVLAAIRLARHGRGAACVSESLNSNNANIVIGLCVPALVLGIGHPSSLQRFDAVAMVVLTILAVTLAFRTSRLTRVDGYGIILLYIAFAIVIVVR
jgi:cation:H+ antiporter